MPRELPIPTPIYRLVHIDNLAACLARGGMYAPNHTPADGWAYRTIHREDIQEGRRTREVPKGPRGTVHDYVPFYFGPRSVMLYQLQTGWVAGYQEGQAPLVHLVSTCQAVAGEGLGFVFTDGHDRQRRKQAEFLVHRMCPWSLLTEVGVYNGAAGDRVQATLRAHGAGALPVRVRSEWYY